MVKNKQKNGGKSGAGGYDQTGVLPSWGGVAPCLCYQPGQGTLPRGVGATRHGSISAAAWLRGWCGLGGGWWLRPCSRNLFPFGGGYRPGSAFTAWRMRQWQFRKSCVVIFTETSFCAPPERPFPMSELKSESTSKQKLSKLVLDFVLELGLGILVQIFHPGAPEIAHESRALARIWYVNKF